MLEVLERGAAPRQAGPLELLATYAEVRAVLPEVEAAVMYRARAAGYTWREIGPPLGLSGQGAGYRYHAVLGMQEDPRIDPRTGGAPASSRARRRRRQA